MRRLRQVWFNKHVRLHGSTSIGRVDNEHPETSKRYEAEFAPGMAGVIVKDKVEGMEYFVWPHCIESATLYPEMEWVAKDPARGVKRGRKPMKVEGEDE